MLVFIITSSSMYVCIFFIDIILWIFALFGNLSSSLTDGE